ncbi:hypothetical protein AB4037_05245 [Labrys sp. KB_33_2]|uniref:hypothetical protein n=1 Tax=Labrys sp. KB_33_2 TaxID=3237479 RepID=UPI003F8F8D4F
MDRPIGLAALMSVAAGQSDVVAGYATAFAAAALVCVIAAMGRMALVRGGCNLQSARGTG